MLALAKVGRVTGRTGMKAFKALRKSKILAKGRERRHERRQERKRKREDIKSKKSERNENILQMNSMTQTTTQTEGSTSAATARFGNPYMKTSNVKRFVGYDQTIQLKQRSLESAPLLNIPRQTTADEINYREGHKIDLAGIKIHFRLINTLPDTLLTVNLAVLAPYARGQLVDINDFFRNNDSTLARDFSISMNNMEMSTLPINTDLYHVLMHKRFRVSGTADVVTAGTRRFAVAYRNHLDFEHWLPIKRQVRFQDDLCLNSLWFVWWLDGFGNPINVAASTSTDYPLSLKTIAYYRDA